MLDAKLFGYEQEQRFLVLDTVLYACLKNNGLLSWIQGGLLRRMPEDWLQTNVTRCYETDSRHPESLPPPFRMSDFSHPPCHRV